jgi:hypothetical protein
MDFAINFYQRQRSIGVNVTPTIPSGNQSAFFFPAEARRQPLNCCFDITIVFNGGFAVHHASLGFVTRFFFQDFAIILSTVQSKLVNSQ